MQIVGQLAGAAGGASGGRDAAGAAGELMARHTAFGAPSVPALREAVAELAKQDPTLAEAVRREVGERLSVTDRAAFAAEPKPATEPATGPEARKLVVDDRRHATSLGELSRWEAGYQEAVKANGGPFANSPQIEAAYADDRARLVEATARADAEVNKLLFVGLGAPALAGGGAAAAPILAGAVGGQFVSATVGRTVYMATSATVGGVTNVALEGGKNVAFGVEHSAGGYAGAALSGALGGTGAKLLGGAAPKVVNDVALGATSGALGEFASQKVDGGLGAAIDGEKVAVATGVGATFAGASAMEVRVGGLNAGRGNSVATYNGLQTRAANGNISGHQLRYGVEAGVGQGITGTAQGVAGTAATGIYQRTTK